MSTASARTQRAPAARAALVIRLRRGPSGALTSTTGDKLIRRSACEQIDSGQALATAKSEAQGPRARHHAFRLTQAGPVRADQVQNAPRDDRQRRRPLRNGRPLLAHAEPHTAGFSAATP